MGIGTIIITIILFYVLMNILGALSDRLSEKAVVVRQKEEEKADIEREQKEKKLRKEFEDLRSVISIPEGFYEKFRSAEKDDEYYSYLGFKFLQAKQYANSIKHYDLAIDLLSKFEFKKKGYLFNRGLAKFNIDDFNGAIKDFILCKSNSEACRFSSLSNAELGNFEQAIKEIDQAYFINKKPSYLEDKANIYLKMSMFREAKKLLEAAILRGSLTAIVTYEKHFEKYIKSNFVNVFFKNYLLDNPKEVLTALSYQSYRNGENPLFNDISSRLLGLKRMEESSINFFKDYLSDYFLGGIVMVTVPSHDPSNRMSGVNMLVKILCNENKMLIDGTKILNRYKKINKLSQGGNRNISVHLESIEVVDCDKIKGKNILLFDDISTTKNSLFACQKLLYDKGAKMVQPFSIAKTVG